jgi:hypothetical protein
MYYRRLQCYLRLARLRTERTISRLNALLLLFI